jgi:Flp pilus assembly protein TadG
MRKPDRAGRRASRAGTAGIEFALLSPLLLIMLTGVAEIGIAGYQAMQVQAAVEAGALYAGKYGGSNLVAVRQAIAGATATTGVVAGATLFCGCPTASGVISQAADCTTVCADGKAPGQYVQVTASLAHQKIMPFLTLPLPATLTAAVMVRVQ